MQCLEEMKGVRNFKHMVVHQENLGQWRTALAKHGKGKWARETLSLKGLTSAEGVLEFVTTRPTNPPPSLS